jgi:hypothetical protein
LCHPVLPAGTPAGGTLGRWIISGAIVAGAAGVIENIDFLRALVESAGDVPADAIRLPLLVKLTELGFRATPRSLASCGRAPRHSPGEPGRIAGAAYLVARLGYMSGVFLDRVPGRSHAAAAVENGATPTGVAILLQAIALRRDGEVPGALRGEGGGR